MTHWGEHDAVLKGEGADFEGGEEFWGVGGECCAGGRRLEGGVEGDLVVLVIGFMREREGERKTYTWSGSIEKAWSRCTSTT